MEVTGNNDMEMNYQGEESVQNYNEKLEDLLDSLQIMFFQEQECIDYLIEEQFQAEGKDDYLCIDKHCRTKMCRWTFEVADFCKYKKATVGIAMAYLDRFVSSDHSRAHAVYVDRKEYQLASMTCLYIAIKLFEPTVLDLKTVSALSRGCYTEEDISKMEVDILEALRWRLHTPTSFDFVHSFMAILSLRYPEKRTMFRILSDYAEFLSELAISEYDLAIRRPSTIAISAVLNALECADTDRFAVNERKECAIYVQRLSSMHIHCPHILDETEKALLESFYRLSGEEMADFACRLKNNIVSSQRCGQSKGNSCIDKSPVCVSRRNSINLIE